jgi:DNA-binding NarL/FixJ family response regulator
MPELPRPPPHYPMNVTPRQAEILTLLAVGLSDKEIAARLKLSPRTVQAHLDRIYLEYGFHKRAAAVAAWIRAQTRSTTERL